MRRLGQHFRRTMPKLSKVAGRQVRGRGYSKLQNQIITREQMILISVLEFCCKRTLKNVLRSNIGQSTKINAIVWLKDVSLKDQQWSFQKFIVEATTIILLTPLLQKFLRISKENAQLYRDVSLHDFVTLSGFVKTALICILFPMFVKQE